MDRAALGVAVGTLTVIVLPILELLSVIAGLGSCSGYRTTDGVLIAITIALAGGGISTLMLASRGHADSTDRVRARRLGTIAIVMAVASLPVNLFVVGLSGFCAVG